MRYYSTRDKSVKVTAARAIAEGLAGDGGLYLPEELPGLAPGELDRLLTLDYRRRASAVMAPFLPEFSENELRAFTEAAYGENYDCEKIAPLRFTDAGTAYLELWHGPTCAFKDMALQMLPYLLTASLKKTGEKREVCVLVATSGDTGKAALEGFADVPGTRIIVFYPKDGVSDMQKLQMTTQSGRNVLVSAVRGNFDDAQAGVKRIFSDREFAEKLSKRGFFLSSANSINWGRLLPQIVYYISAYCDYVNSGGIKMGEPLDFCVPTGNFGNILAGWLAKRMGLPVGKLVCASNSNDVLTDFIKTGVYDRNREFFTTISPSMDILVSSNLERLLCCVAGDAEVRRWMAELSEKGRYEVPPETLAAIRSDFDCGRCGDEAAKSRLKKVWEDSGCLIDTHTAVAAEVLSEYRARTGEMRPTVIVSTASPYKFCGSVLEALGAAPGGPEELRALTGVPIPAPLEGLAQRPVLFDGCVEKKEMAELVDGFLTM